MEYAWPEINVFAGFDENGEVIINILGRDVTEAHEKADSQSCMDQAQGYDENRFQGKRILLAEDNALNAEIATEILEMTGMTVEHAADGVEAVDKLVACADGYYDMILMDIQMPKMNGYDAARAIRAMDRHYCKQVPIVAMTANAFAEDVYAAKTAGMNEHIAKPLDLSTLARILKKWIP